MSKAAKKVTKSAKKFVSKTIKTFDPGLDQLLGLSRQDEQRKQAERMAKIAETQATQQQANAVEQARAQAMQIQTDVDRQRILAEQQQQNQTPDDTGAVSVDVAPVATDAATRRKKFQTPQVGGTGSGGASIRL